MASFFHRIINNDVPVRVDTAIVAMGMALFVYVLREILPTPYPALALGSVLGCYLVWRTDFKFFPALALLFLVTGVISFVVLVTMFCVVFVRWHRGGLSRQIGRWPDILIIPLSLLVLYMTFLGCINKGFYYNQPHYLELWSLLSLYAFYYGMEISRTVTPRRLLLLSISAIIVLMCDIANELRHSEVIRVLFLFGPFFVPLAIWAFARKRWWYLLLAAMGCALFFIAMNVGLPTFTLQGTGYLAGIMMVLYLLRLKKPLFMFRSLIAFFAVFAFMVFVIINMASYSPLVKYGRSSVSSGKLEVIDFNSLVEKIQMKIFDDRAVLWRAAWLDTTRAPYLARSSAIRSIRGTENAAGEMLGDIEYGAHNVYLEMLSRLRWPGGILFSVLFILFVVRAGGLLSVFRPNSVIMPMCITVVAVGIYGGMTGTFPVLYTFGFIFMTLAGVCFQAQRDHATAQLRFNLPSQELSVSRGRIQ